MALARTFKPPARSRPRNCCTKRGETSLLISCIPQRAGARRPVARALERQQGSSRDPLLLQKPAHHSCVSFRDQWSVARVLWPWLRALAPTAFPPQCAPARLPSACVRRERERERELALAYHMWYDILSCLCGVLGLAHCMRAREHARVHAQARTHKHNSIPRGGDRPSRQQMTNTNSHTQ